MAAKRDAGDMDDDDDDDDDDDGGDGMKRLMERLVRPHLVAGWLVGVVSIEGVVPIT